MSCNGNGQALAGTQPTQCTRSCYRVERPDGYTMRYGAVPHHRRSEFLFSWYWMGKYWHKRWWYRDTNGGGRCVMCDIWNMETAEHLFFSCPYAIRVWCCIEVKLGSKLLNIGDSIQHTWEISRPTAMGTSTKVWAARFMCVLWFVWKQRNDKVFHDKLLLPWNLTNKIIEEGNLWVKYCRCAGTRKRMRIG